MRTITQALLVTLALSASACATTPASGPTALPAEVAAIVEARCGNCHGASISGGAPMTLVTWESMHAASITRPSEQVFQTVAARIHDAARPMPASGMLPANELAILDDWIAAGAPPGNGSYVAPMPVEVGPEYLPCTPTAEFRAHAPGNMSEPFHLEPGAGSSGNSTLCFAFAAPFGDATQGTAFAPIIDDPRVLHHWIIFASESLPAGISAGDMWDCGASGGITATSQFLQGWAPGGLNTVFPEDQGRELPGPAAFIVLQVHYWNVANHADVFDRSGVAVCTTETPRTHEVGTSILGSLDLAIPPRANQHEVVGTCTPAITAPVTIVSSGPHMHTRGVSISTEVIRADGAREMLVDVPHWDFNSQTGEPAPGGALVIRPGDRLRTRCVYDNLTSEPITFGERTEDEMCFNFISAYPAGAIATEIGRPRRLCID